MLKNSFHQQQTEKGLTLGHLECTITVQTKKISYYDYELRKYKIAIAAIQETRWNKLTYKPLRAMVITSIPAALPIIMDLKQLF
jgi:hypothetical protein